MIHIFMLKNRIWSRIRSGMALEVDPYGMRPKMMRIRRDPDPQKWLFPHKNKGANETNKKAAEARRQTSNLSILVKSPKHHSLPTARQKRGIQHKSVLGLGIRTKMSRIPNTGTNCGKNLDERSRRAHSVNNLH